MAIEVGMKLEKRLKTGPEHSARKFFQGVPDVFGTPFLGGLFEGTSAELMARHLAPGEMSVGVTMNLRHTAPTPLGYGGEGRHASDLGGRPEDHLQGGRLRRPGKDWRGGARTVYN